MGENLDKVLGKQPGNILGMKKAGNLEPFDRPQLKNPDGSISTTSSISIGTDDGEVVIPTVVDGKRLPMKDAIERYRKTGEHFGVFDTPENADKFAVDLHNQQADKIFSPQKKTLRDVLGSAVPDTEGEK